MEEPIQIYIIGFIAQLFFSARSLTQWILSERAKRVLSPTIFWQFSLMASFLYLIYGWLREDFSIMLGQLITYYIYIWNLDNKGGWKKLYRSFRAILLLTPLFVILYFLLDWKDFIIDFFENKDLPLSMIIFGSVGQTIFALRFVYQWLYSRRRGESLLPIGFWIISMTGCLIILTYGIYRQDPIVILGQGSGFVVYIRNIYLACREHMCIIKCHKIE